MTDGGWIDTGEEVAIRYRPTGALDDGTHVFVADGPVPEGIPVETHVIGGIQVKAIYADGFIDDDRYPHPSRPGERWSLSEGRWVCELLEDEQGPERPAD